MSEYFPPSIKKASAHVSSSTPVNTIVIGPFSSGFVWMLVVTSAAWNGSVRFQQQDNTGTWQQAAQFTAAGYSTQYSTAISNTYLYALPYPTPYRFILDIAATLGTLDVFIEYT